MIHVVEVVEQYVGPLYEPVEINRRGGFGSGSRSDYVAVYAEKDEHHLHAVGGHAVLRETLGEIHYGRRFR